MNKYKAIACLGLMYYVFEAENEEEARKVAEEWFNNIKHCLLYEHNTYIQDGGISVIPEV